MSGDHHVHLTDRLVGAHQLVVNLGVSVRRVGVPGQDVDNLEELAHRQVQPVVGRDSCKKQPKVG